MKNKFFYPGFFLILILIWIAAIPKILMLILLKTDYASDSADELLLSDPMELNAEEIAQ